MTAAQKVPTTPVRYLGPLPTFEGVLYGAKLKIAKGKVALVGIWAAMNLIRHPEFEDARSPKNRKPLDATKPIDDDEAAQVGMVAQAINIDNMSRVQLVQHAIKSYGVRLDAEAPRETVVGQVRDLVKRDR